MWAGPLCAHILGAGGASVVKVEDPDRPDGSRAGDPLLFSRLHEGHDVAAVRFTTPAGRRRLHELVASADVVIEASRPRALQQLGFSPRQFLEQRQGRTWISITGYGRSGDRANYLAFGDDAAVAGGLVAWASPDTPVFCADAVADPISGLYAAFGGFASMLAGGGHLIDVSMCEASAFVIQGPRCTGRHTVAVDPNGGWSVSHDDLCQNVVRPILSFSPR
jgi:crotonobetainyl-CoA:carnitine CoA-transferase CaiB-like acyl-CoA transferase